MTTIQGRVRKFGDNIDTDNITPGKFLHLPMDEIVKHIFELIVPDFPGSVQPGDVILAGANFGCGSSREQATAAVIDLGIRFIICESMARIYFRNCIALGIYPILTKEVCYLFEEGDRIEIDLEQGIIVNPCSGKSITFEPLSGTPHLMVAGGGIVPLLKKVIGQS